MRQLVTEKICKAILLPALAILALEGCTTTTKPENAVVQGPEQPAYTESVDEYFRRYALSKDTVSVELIAGPASGEIVQILATQAILDEHGKLVDWRICHFEPLKRITPAPGEIRALLELVHLNPAAAPEGFEEIHIESDPLPRMPRLPHGPPPSIPDCVLLD